MRRRMDRGGRTPDLGIASGRMTAHHPGDRGRERADGQTIPGQRGVPTSGTAVLSTPLMLVLVSTAVLVVVLDVLIGGYVDHWAWTGYRVSQHKLRTLWDWLGVSLLPLAVALTPVWLGTRGRRRRAWRIAGSLVAAVLGLLVLGGYLLRWRWTGFTGNSLYDWLQLFLVPCVLPMAFSVLGPKDSEASAAQRGASAHAENGGSRVAWGARGVLTMAAAAVVLVGTVAALLVGGSGRTEATAGHTQVKPRTPSSSGAPASASRHRWLIVDSQDPWWTDTGVHVTAGQSVTISAVGHVRASSRRGYPWASAAGLSATSTPPGHLSMDNAIGHAALVATVGDAMRLGRLDQAPSPHIIEVGTRHTILIRRDGELFLGLNDMKVDDNRGWFGVTITLSRAR
jgi:hypothetical protein